VVENKSLEADTHLGLCGGVFTRFSDFPALENDPRSKNLIFRGCVEILNHSSKHCLHILCEDTFIFHFLVAELPKETHHFPVVHRSSPPAGGVLAPQRRHQAPGAGHHAARGTGGGGKAAGGADADGTTAEGTAANEAGGDGVGEVGEVGEGGWGRGKFGGDGGRGIAIFDILIGRETQEELHKMLLERQKERLAEQCVEQLAQLKEQLAEDREV